MCAVQIPDVNLGFGRHLHCPPLHRASSSDLQDLSLSLQLASCEQLKSGGSLHKHLSASQIVSCPSTQSTLLTQSFLPLQLRSGGAVASSQTHCLSLQVGVPLLPGPPPAQKLGGQSLISLQDPGAGDGPTASQTHCLSLQVGVPLLPGPPPAQKLRGQSLCSLHAPGARAGRGISMEPLGSSSLESSSGLVESPESIVQPSCRLILLPVLKTCESLGDQESDRSGPGTV